MTLQFPQMPEQITKAESRILDYISNNPEEFLLSSIGEVGEKLDVSGTTISRFVRRLGCGDYKELRRLVADQNVSEGPAVKLMQTLHSEEAFTVDNWFLRQQMYLQKTLEGLEQEEFQKAVSALCSAHRVFIHAKSASSSLGQLLMFRLRRLGIQSVLLPSGGSEVLEGLSQAKAGDLVAMFSFSKLSQEGKMILGYRKEAGYQTLAFISRAFVPEEERADIQLFAYRGEAKEYHSMTAPAALVDALVVAVSEQMGEFQRHAVQILLHQLVQLLPKRQRDTFPGPLTAGILNLRTVDRRQCLLRQLEDGTNGIFLRKTAETVSSLFPAAADQHAAFIEGTDNQLQIFHGDILSLCDIFQRYQFSVIVLCQIDHHPKRVSPPG